MTVLNYKLPITKCFVLLLLQLQCLVVNAFNIQNKASFLQRNTQTTSFTTANNRLNCESNAFNYKLARPTTARKSQRMMMSVDLTMPIMDVLSSSSTTSTSMYLATIDADIANIPTDQFGLVFAGGITVMFGGVLSALIVGGILNVGQSYGRVIADSYIEEGKDEIDPFSNMTDEERAKAEELLEKFRASKKGAKIPESLTIMKKDTSSNSASDTIVEAENNEKPAEQKKEKVSMFSDYDD